jgi:hypothetical protein
MRQFLGLNEAPTEPRSASFGGLLQKGLGCGLMTLPIGIAFSGVKKSLNSDAPPTRLAVN